MLWALLALRAVADEIEDCRAFVSTYSYGVYYDPDTNLLQRDPTSQSGRFWECASTLLGQTIPMNKTIVGTHHPVWLNPAPLRILPANDFVVSAYTMFSGAYDPMELAILQSLVQPGQTVLEVGANVGSYAVGLAERLGYDGLLVCMEPFRIVYQILTGNMAINGLRNVITLNFGGGDKPRRVRVKSPGFRSIANLGAMRIDHQQSAEVATLSYEGEEIVEIRPVDTVEALDERPVDLLKIDVEGMEETVIEGAIQTILRDRPLILAENQAFFNADLTEAQKRRFVDLLATYDYRCLAIEELKIHHILICKSIKPRPSTAEWDELNRVRKIKAREVMRLYEESKLNELLA